MKKNGLNIVTIGGGTGLSTLLRGLKSYVDAGGGWSIGRLGAIVTVTDEGGRELVGEAAISGSPIGEKRSVAPHHARIVHLAIDPPDAPPVQRALDALRDADMILIGPGSLYTSVLPNLEIKEIAEALRQAK